VNLPTGFFRARRAWTLGCQQIGDCVQRHCRSLAHHLQGPSQHTIRSADLRWSGL